MAAASLTGVSSSASTRVPAQCVRLFHLWHLYSLDAPTVAWAFLLMFADAAKLPHASASACALASAVWLIYAGDRLLDGVGPLCAVAPLHALYRQHVRRFMVAAACCAVVCVAALRLVALPLVLGWSAMLAPLTAYAVAVHRNRLPSRSKPLCIAVFFAAAMLVSCVASAGLRESDLAGIMAAGFLFGEVCRRNCALLQNRTASPRSTLLLGIGCVAAGLAVPRVAPVTAACGAAGALLLLLGRERHRFSALTFRALADAAIALPALVLLAW